MSIIDFSKTTPIVVDLVRWMRESKLMIDTRGSLVVAMGPDTSQ